MSEHRFTEADIERAKASMPLSSLVGSRVRLKRAGNEFTGCCPVHNEKNPSFSVVDTKGFAHCFGCGFHADHISWLTEMEGMSFTDAVRYLLGESVRSSGSNVQQRESYKQQQEPEIVDSFEVAKHVVSLCQPIAGTIVETYLRSRGIEPNRLAGYLNNLAFVPNCPVSSWRVGSLPSSVKAAPAIVAPIHSISRRTGMIGGGLLETKLIGAHVTYLSDDGQSKLIRKNRDGETLPSRKMFGEHQGGAILFTGMANSSVPLVEGEGLETTLAGALMILRHQPIIRLAATLSLNNHQGYVVKGQDGAIPLWDARLDATRRHFGFEQPGSVISLIDADMSAHNVKVRRTRSGPLETGITRQERTSLCERLVGQKWRHFKAASHRSIAPPDGMDFNDHWRALHADAF